MGGDVRLTIENQREVMAVFEGLPASIQKKILRPAFNAGGREVVKDARGNLNSNRSVRTGALRRSLTTRIKIYRNGTVVALVGPSRKYATTHKGKPVVPWRYAHLVEKGTARGVRRRPFLRPALKSQTPAIRRQTAAKFRQVIKREVDRLSILHKARIADTSSL